MTSYENDDQSEKLGIVVLLYFIGDIPLDWDPDLQRKAPKSLDILPMKVNSVHFCCDSKLASITDGGKFAHLVRLERDLYVDFVYL